MWPRMHTGQLINTNLGLRDLLQVSSADDWAGLFLVASKSHMKMLSASAASREGQLVLYHIGLSVVTVKYMQIDW